MTVYFQLSASTEKEFLESVIQKVVEIGYLDKNIVGYCSWSAHDSYSIAGRGRTGLLVTNSSASFIVRYVSASKTNVIKLIAEPQVSKTHVNSDGYVPTSKLVYEMHQVLSSRITPLWHNNDGTSAFGPQVVTISGLSSYTFLIVEARSQGAKRGSTVILPPGAIGQLTTFETSGSWRLIVTRKVERTNDTISFGEAIEFGFASGQYYTAEQNVDVIPTNIWGIK